jgi:hypothetical protein
LLSKTFQKNTRSSAVTNVARHTRHTTASIIEPYQLCGHGHGVIN